MKSRIRQFTKMLCLSLVMLGITVRAQSTDNAVAATVEEKPFDVGTYMGADRIVNLMLVVRQANRVTFKIKNADNAVVHEYHLKKSVKAYHYKLNFDESQSGVYQLEISDGRRTLVQRVDVVNIPAIESQRYVTFTSPYNSVMPDLTLPKE